MSRGGRGDLAHIVRQAIAAPHDVHIRAQQDDIVLIEIARARVWNLEDGHRCSVRSERVFKASSVDAGAPQPQDGKSVAADAILDRRTIVEPDVRQPRAGPCGRTVLAEEMLRSARNIADD